MGGGGGVKIGRYATGINNEFIVISLVLMIFICVCWIKSWDNVVVSYVLVGQNINNSVTIIVLSIEIK